MRHRSLTSLLLLSGGIMMGCQGSPGDSPEDSQAVGRTDVAAESSESAGRPANHLRDAKRYQQTEDWDSAAEAIHKALIQTPGDEATLVASQIEAARGNSLLAVELARSIDVGSPLGAMAVKVHAEQLVKQKRHGEAADVILSEIRRRPTRQLRRNAWTLLNRCGRREEASRQADVLCQQGKTTPEELLSLLGRTDSFPRQLSPHRDPPKAFDPGLGLARWYFTQQQFQQAIDELTPQFESTFETPAACALYGRLLAETQSVERFPAWYAMCDESTKVFGDYWAALGAYFLDQNQWEASARALLEAVYRNPTDVVCVQRLSKAFDAMGDRENGTEFRFRGVRLTRCLDYTEKLDRSDVGLNRMSRVAEYTLALGRPFESFQWATAIIAPMQGVKARAKQRQIDQKRQRLLNQKNVSLMASELSMPTMDRTVFKIDSAIQAYLRDATASVAFKAPAGQVLASPCLNNVASEVGLDFQWFKDVEIDLVSIPIHELPGGGIAVLDYDLDGWPDVYLAQGSGEPPTDKCTRPSLLFRNLGGTFRQATSSQTEDHNYSSGLAAGDVNQDGFIDLLLGSVGHNRLLINNGDGTFRDATESMGAIDDRFTSSVAIADINGDTLPDLFEANYITMDEAFVLPKRGDDGLLQLPSPGDHRAEIDRWFQNRGDGTFKVHEISREVAKPGTSLGIMVTDFDSNGTNEVFVGNDMRPNHLLVLGAENVFRNEADVKGIANGFDGAGKGCMGIAAGDFNRDGKIDLHITNYYNESANLYQQAGSGGYSDLAIRYGIREPSELYVGFGTKAIDFDRNGWLDLVVTNGHIFDLRRMGHPFKMPPQMLMRTESRFEITEVKDDTGYWKDTFVGRTMTSLDFDRDGRMDLLINHLDQPLALLQNQTETTGSWIQFELIGTTSERDAVGARVVVTAGKESFTQWVTAGDGYLCSDEPLIDFGLGNHAHVDQVEIFWPSGEQQRYGRLPSGKRYLVIEGQADVTPR